MDTDKSRIDKCAEKTTEAFNQIEQMETVGLKQSQSNQQNRDVALKRERKRLAKKYGNNHRRVTKIDQEVKINPTFFKALKEQTVRSETKPKPPQTDIWNIYGTIRDEKNNRLSKQTVSLFDDQGNPVKDLGYVCTNENGFYDLKVKDSNGRLNILYNNKPLTLTINDENKKIIHQEKEPLFFTTGSSENREIVILSDACSPPYEFEEERNDYLVEGYIKNKDGKPLKDLLVRAVDQDFTGENLLGESTTNETGYYRISYNAKDFIIDGKESGGADIILYIYFNKKIIHETDVYRNSSKKRNINLSIVESH